MMKGKKAWIKYKRAKWEEIFALIQVENSNEHSTKFSVFFVYISASFVSFSLYSTMYQSWQPTWHLPQKLVFRTALVSNGIGEGGTLLLLPVVWLPVPKKYRRNTLISTFNYLFSIIIQNINPSIFISLKCWIFFRKTGFTADFRSVF